MHVLVLGATGYIGSVVVEHLVAAGHRVTGVSRSAGSPQPGVTAVAADLRDAASVAALVTADVDGVIHAAAPLGDADRALADALVTALAGSGRPLVWTSGTWVLGSAGRQPADEASATAPIMLVASRVEVESRVLAGSERDARPVVVRPGIVHGRGGGIPAMLVGWAEDHGYGRWVGGIVSPRWPLVDVDDLADLYVLALERAASGTILHGVAETGTPVEMLALAATEAAGVERSAVAWPEDEAAGTLGDGFAEALALDQVVTAERARMLGWSPTRPDAATDLAAGTYLRTARPHQSETASAA